MKIVLLKLITIFLIISSLLVAYDFKPQGSKTIGIDGAGVASVRAGMAFYYNLAMLGFKKYNREFSTNINLAFRDYNLIDTYNKLDSLGLEYMLDRVGDNALLTLSNTQKDRDNIKEAQNIIKNLSGDNGFLSSTAYLQINKSYGIGIFI
jgi:hypothetical protein